MTKEQFRGKMKDIVYRFFIWILNPINILGLISYPIITGVIIHNRDCEHKSRLWCDVSKVYLVESLKYMWKVFTFRASSKCTMEYFENFNEKTEEILEKEG